MKDQMIELAFYVEHGGDQIGIYRTKKNGNWVFNIVVQNMKLITAKGKRKRPTLYGNFTDLKSFMRVQTGDEWFDQFSSAFESVNELTNYQWFMMWHHYVHQDYRDDVGRRVDFWFSSLGDAWDETFKVNETPETR